MAQRGLGNELTINMMATYRAATFVVAAEMINVTMAKQSGIEIWKNLSPVLSACQALANVVMTPRIYGGHVSSKVTTLEYSSVLTTVGKKLVTEAADTLPKRRTS